MKIWILHDSNYGNGRKVAEILGDLFSESEVKIGNAYLVEPERVVSDLPDVLILGSAVGRFDKNASMKKWVTKLNRLLQENNKSISSVFCFATHISEEHKVSDQVDKFMNLVQGVETFSQVHPNCIMAQVEETEGSLKIGVMAQIINQGHHRISWIMNKGPQYGAILST